ncbi:MAG: AAA family ATPase [Gammaproteobacteria bacterium]
MYQEFFGLCATPFDLNTDPRFLYLSPKHARARAYLDYAVYKGDSLVVITGEIGIGKSTLIHDLTDRIDGNTEVIVMHHPHDDTVEFLQALLLSWGIDTPATSKPALLSQIRTELEVRFTWDTRTTLIVDEAQTLTREVLEELRLLADQEIDSQKPLGIVLIGQPCLNATLAGREMEQLRQRIRLSFHLSALSEEETKGYIERRLDTAGADGRTIFLDETLPRIYKYTGGVPRLINVLADLALTAAWMDRKNTVSSVQVNDAIKELGWLPYSRRMRYMPALSLPMLPSIENWGGRLRLVSDRASQGVRSMANSVTSTSKRLVAGVIVDAVRAKEITWTPLNNWVQERAIPGTRNNITNSRLALQSKRKQIASTIKDASHKRVESLRVKSAEDDWFSPSTVRGITIGFAAAMVVSMFMMPIPNKTQPVLLSDQSADSTVIDELPKASLQAVVAVPAVHRAEGVQSTLTEEQESTQATVNTMVSVKPPVETEAVELELDAQLKDKRSWELEHTRSASAEWLQRAGSSPDSSEFGDMQSDAPWSGLQPEEWVMAQSPDTYIIQILAAKKREVVSRFLQGEIADLDMAYYRKNRNQEEWFVLVSGTYDSYNSAKQASLSLPEKARKAKPWIRSIADVQQDILKAKNVKTVM